MSYTPHPQPDDEQHRARIPINNLMGWVSNEYTNEVERISGSPSAEETRIQNIHILGPSCSLYRSMAPE